MSRGDDVGPHGISTRQPRRCRDPSTEHPRSAAGLDYRGSAAGSDGVDGTSSRSTPPRRPRARRRHRREKTPPPRPGTDRRRLGVAAATALVFAMGTGVARTGFGGGLPVARRGGALAALAVLLALEGWERRAGLWKLRSSRRRVV